MEEREHDFKFSILIFGNSGVGKTSLNIRYAQNTFTDKYYNTLGLQFQTKTINIEDKLIAVGVWDFEGVERFRRHPALSSETNDYFIIVYDISNRNSFESIIEWINSIELYSKSESKIVLVGNKSDLISERQVSEDEGKILADEFDANFFETSAKTGYNVEETFDFIIKDMFEIKKQLEEKKIMLKKQGIKSKRNKCSN